MNIMYAVIPWTAWILNVHLNLGRDETLRQSSSRCRKPLTTTVDDVIGVNEDVRKHQTKRMSYYGPQHIHVKGDLIPSAFVWEAAQNVDSVVCIHVKRHQSARRWIIFGGICTFCNMLMSKAAKARLPGERRGDGGREKEGGEQSGKERNRRRLV